MRWSTLIELAPQVGIELPSDPKRQREEFLITTQMKDLESVLKKFLRAQRVLASTEILERLAFEACEDAYNDGVIVMEMRYAPTFITDGHPSLNFESVHQALHRGIERAKSRFPIAAGLIGIVQRIKPLAEAERVVDFVIDHKDSFIGLDLADNEDGFDPLPFAPLFMKAKKAGLRITVHSGEIPHPQSPKWVKASVEILGAERIGHGIQIIQSPEVMAFIRDRKIPLEVCPHSNWLTQAFPDHAAHPVRKLHEAGIIITVNSDDPGLFASTLTDDYEILQRVHRFTPHEFAAMNEEAVRASFIPAAEIRKVWASPSKGM
ncbi:MAG: adenosine deaminase [Bdellovibrionaceae bacterium]|nr:adenosine deaminase [Pseudobdellovibrionaceae bacterium]